jgi:hypothetical protein
MTKEPGFEIRWLPMELDESEKTPPNQDWNTDDPLFAEPNLNDPAENCFAAKQMKWAQERLAHSEPRSFDADFLSGVLLATLRRDGQVTNETLSGVHRLDDGALVSVWFLSGYLSTRLLWGRVDFSSLRFTPELLESVMAAMRLKYDSAGHHFIVADPET